MSPISPVVKGGAAVRSDFSSSIGLAHQCGSPGGGPRMPKMHKGAERQVFGVGSGA